MRKEGILTIRKIEKLLFPLRCPVCDRPVPVGEGEACLKCRNQLVKVSGAYCMKCGKPLLTQQEYCMDCENHRHLFCAGRGLYVYTHAAGAIYRFKYSGRQEYAAFFGQQMAEAFASYIKAIRPDALIPVPLHEERLQKRGYNQAELLAAELGRRVLVPVAGRMVVRVKNTIPQKELNLIQRQNNLKKAFKIVANDVKLKTIILIDDIYTTGSTMDALTAVLLEAGVEKVYFLTLSIGGPD